MHKLSRATAVSVALLAPAACSSGELSSPASTEPAVTSLSTPETEQPSATFPSRLEERITDLAALTNPIFDDLVLAEPYTDLGTSEAGDREFHFSLVGDVTVDQVFEPDEFTQAVETFQAMAEASSTVDLSVFDTDEPSFEDRVTLELQPSTRDAEVVVAFGGIPVEEDVFLGDVVPGVVDTREEPEIAFMTTTHEGLPPEVVFGLACNLAMEATTQLDTIDLGLSADDLDGALYSATCETLAYAYTAASLFGATYQEYAETERQALNDSPRFDVAQEGDGLYTAQGIVSAELYQAITEHRGMSLDGQIEQIPFDPLSSVTS